MNIKTKHIDEYPQDQLKGLCKQYYIRARKAEKEVDELKTRIRSLENDLSSLHSSVYDMVSVFEGLT